MKTRPYNNDLARHDGRLSRRGARGADAIE
jgi:hypothetical protein